jgi:two-component system nitrate/nitrite response regulator NarL
VVARDPLVRSGLAAVLGAYPGLVLREALETADGAVAADVVVWDAPDAAPHAAVTPVLVLVNATQDARQALRSGARGALSREASFDAIAPAALAVASGHWVLDAAFAGALLNLGEADAPAAPSPAPVAHTPAARVPLAPALPSLLSPREQQVLTLLSEGLSNRDVAARLGISRHTAKFHVNAILDKLGATTRTEAVVLAARSGLLTL